MVGIWLNFIIPLQKFGEGAIPPPKKKKWGPKTCKISVNFAPLRMFDREYTRKEATYPKLENVTNYGAIPTVFNEKSPVNFGPLTTWNYM